MRNVEENRDKFEKLWGHFTLGFIFIVLPISFIMGVVFYPPILAISLCTLFYGTLIVWYIYYKLYH